MTTTSSTARSDDEESRKERQVKEVNKPESLERGVEPIPDPDVDFVEQFVHLVPALWRTMRRATVSARDLPANESQVTILRLVIHHGRLTTAQLADIMHLARPTVSNLLKGMVAEGLVERIVSQRDARVMTVIPTDTGRELLTRFRADRADIVRAGFDLLDADDQRDVVAAAPALRRLLRHLEKLADEAETEVAAASLSTLGEVRG